MKFQIVLLLVAVAATALSEPPRRRARPVWGARLEAAAAPPAQEAPYPPSGWRPATPFYLPGEYGGPEVEGGAPEPEEGAPTTTEAAQETTTAAAEDPTTTTAPEEGDNDGAEARDNDAEYDEEPEPAPANIPAGVYYVLLPDGRLQRVNYQLAAPAGPVSGSYVLQDATSYFSSPIYAYQPPSLVQILKK